MRFFLINVFLASALIGQSDAVRLLPPEQFQSGWRYDFEPETFSAETLHEYINGEAELYRQFDVVEAATASYIQLQQNWSLTVDIYDMGSALNAFGIYSHYRRPDLTFAEIGEQAIVSDYQIRFYKSRFYVQLNASLAGSGLQHVMRKWAGSIAEKIKPVQKPALLQLLPDSLSVPNSARLYLSSFAGLEFGARFLVQSYQSDTTQFKAFAAQYSTPAEAKNLLETISSSPDSNDTDFEIWQHYDFLVGLRGEFSDDLVAWLKCSTSKNRVRQ